MHLYLNVYTMSVPKNTDKGGDFEVTLGPRNFKKRYIQFVKGKDFSNLVPDS